MKNYNPNKSFSFGPIIVILVLAAMCFGAYSYTQENGQAGPWGQTAPETVKFTIFGN